MCSQHVLYHNESWIIKVEDTNNLSSSDDLKDELQTRMNLRIVIKTETKRRLGYAMMILNQFPVAWEPTYSSPKISGLQRWADDNQWPSDLENYWIIKTCRKQVLHLTHLSMLKYRTFTKNPYKPSHYRTVIQKPWWIKNNNSLWHISHAWIVFFSALGRVLFTNVVWASVPKRC